MIVILLFFSYLLGMLNQAAGQTLPSFPGEIMHRYEVPEVSKDVKSITETLRSISEESDILKVQRITRTHFYADGIIKRVDFFNAASKKLRGSVYFDSLGRIIKRERLDSGYLAKFRYDDKQGISFKIRPEPDVYGIKDEIIYYDLKLLKPKIKKRYRSKDMLIDSAVYHYNNYGDLNLEIVYNTSGYGMTLSSSFTGDEEKKYVLAHDTTRFEYKYSKTGKMIEKTEFRSKDPFKRYSYSQSGDTLITTIEDYDEFSDIKWEVEEVFKESGDTTIKLIYLNSRYYDDFKEIYKNGRLTSLIRFKDGKITDQTNHTYDITRDAKGHWIEIKHFKEGQLVEVKSREIQYRK